MCGPEPQLPDVPGCPRQLSELLTPGNYESPDGPREERNTYCLRAAGHDGDHVFATWEA